MSDGLTVRLDDANAEWLAAEADDRDRSKAWVLNESLRAIRGIDSVYSPAGGDDITADHRDVVTTEHQHGDGVTLVTPVIRTSDLMLRGISCVRFHTFLVAVIICFSWGPEGVLVLVVLN